MKFGEKLTMLRKRKGLSQEDLASALGVSRQSISKWELSECEPNIKKIKTIARLFEVSIDYLLDDDIDNQPTDAATDAERNPQKIVVVHNSNYWWIFILIGTIGIITCTIIPYVFEHDYCGNGHSGFLGYLGDWCGNAIAWKICFVIAIAAFILGIVKTFWVKKKKKN